MIGILDNSEHSPPRRKTLLMQQSEEQALHTSQLVFASSHSQLNHTTLPKPASPLIIDPMDTPSVPYPSFAHKTKPPPVSADDTELCIFDAEKYFNEVHDQIEMGDSRKRFLTLHDPTAPLRLSSDSSSTDTCSRNFRTRSFRSYVTPTASSEASWNSQTGLLSNPPGSVPISVRDTPCERKRGTASPRWQRFRTKCPCLGRKSVSISESSLSSDPRSPPPINNIRPRIQSNGDAPQAANVGACESKPRNSNTQAKLCNEEISKSILNSRHSFSTEVEHLFRSEIGGQRSLIIAGRPLSDATTAGFTFPNLKPSISSATSTQTATTSPSSPPIKKVLDGLTISSQSPIHGITTSPLLSPPDDLPWDSLEVFQLSEGATFSRHKNQIPIHPPPKNQFFAVPPLRVPVPGRKDGLFPMDNDDAASDASSDLFEIESFSTQSTAYPNHSPATTLQAMNESAYEPSEASVTWSVTTAEGPLGDRGSVVTSYSVSASDVEEFTRLQLRLHRELELRSSGGGAQGGNIAVVGSGKRRSTNNHNGGGLLGCRSEKAVNVGPNPVNIKLAAENGGHVHNKGSAAGGTTNNYAIMPPSSATGTTTGGGPTKGSMPKHMNSRAVKGVDSGSAIVLR